MIGFFRRIRKKLADDNKPMKYMRYAIGEILLVVIGILIALQVNSWNEGRKEKILERNYLRSIKKELETNIQIALGEIEFSEFQAKNGELILNCLDNNFQPNLTEFVIAIEHLGWGTSIKYIKNVWGELYSTGNIEIIRNNSIKNNLTNLYIDMSLVHKLQENEWTSYNLGYRRLVGDILPSSIRIKINEILTPFAYTGEPLNNLNQEGLIENLKKLKGLNGYLIDIVTTRKTSKGFMLRQIELMRNIVDMIDEELE
jgi:hypothetical protein